MLDAPAPEPDSVLLPLPSVPVVVALAPEAADDRTLAPEAEAVEAVAEPLALERAPGRSQFHRSANCDEIYLPAQ